MYDRRPSNWSTAVATWFKTVRKRRVISICQKKGLFGAVEVNGVFGTVRTDVTNCDKIQKRRNPCRCTVWKKPGGRQAQKHVVELRCEGTLVSKMCLKKSLAKEEKKNVQKKGLCKSLGGKKGLFFVGRNKPYPKTQAMLTFFGVNISKQCFQQGICQRETPKNHIILPGFGCFCQKKTL